MNKVDRFGYECELCGAEQMIHMIRHELRKRKTNVDNVLKWSKELKDNAGYIEFNIQRQVVS